MVHIDAKRTYSMKKEIAKNQKPVKKKTNKKTNKKT